MCVVSLRCFVCVFVFLFVACSIAGVVLCLCEFVFCGFVVVLCCVVGLMVVAFGCCFVSA